MEDRLRVAREERDPPIVLDVGHRGPAGDRGGRGGCREPHEARQREDTGKRQEGGTTARWLVSQLSQLSQHAFPF